MHISRDKKLTHLHFPHLQFYLMGIFLILLLIGLFFFGVAALKHYLIGFYDSSLNGSEIKEEQQNTIPQDVKQTVQIPSSLKVPILMFHYVEYVQDKGDKLRIALDTTPYTLEQEIKTLSEAGYTFMTAGELAEALDDKNQLPKKPIVLTFDDGYRDFYTDAYPILKKYHVKATQYVISGFLNNSNHLTVAQLQEIAGDNLVEIGAHTVHHVWLKGQSIGRISDEVFKSKVALGKLIGKPVVSFAYPFGAFDQNAVSVVKEAGFTNAVSTIPGVEQKYRYFLFRLRPGGRTGENLLDWLDKIK